MPPVTLFLVCIAAIFLIGTFGEVVFTRTKVPDVVWLIVVGIILGPVLGLVSRAQLLGIAPYFSALTLVFVLFEGGSRLDLVQLYRATPRSVLLSVLGFSFSTVAVMLVSRLLVEAGLLPVDWTWRQELLTGAIVGGTSPIVIMAAIARVGMPPRVANMVSLESALSDVLCIVAVSSLIGIFHVGGAVGSTPWVALARSLGLGVVLGSAGGLLWLLTLNWLQQNEHAYPITLSALLLLYVLVEGAGGSGALGVLAFAVVVGNAGHIGRLANVTTELALHDDVRGFHSQMVFIIKSFFFTFVGAMLGPPWSLAAAGALLALVLLLARYPSAWLAMLGSSLDRGQRELVFLSLPRGVAAGVLATMPVAAGIPGMQELPTVVFACVFGTILIFAAGFPLVLRRQAGVPGGVEEALPPLE
ncbi:MAG TPA: cation:proton antiporter [Candidatus Eisenbacteria bacterium]|nr:cation:proton antiporter [Candidatus Eisenbacteria bacterium]